VNYKDLLLLFKSALLSPDDWQSCLPWSFPCGFNNWSVFTDWDKDWLVAIGFSDEGGLHHIYIGPYPSFEVARRQIRHIRCLFNNRVRADDLLKKSLFMAVHGMTKGQTSEDRAKAFEASLRMHEALHEY